MTDTIDPSHELAPPHEGHYHGLLIMYLLLAAALGLLPYVWFASRLYPQARVSPTENAPETQKNDFSIGVQGAGVKPGIY